VTRSREPGRTTGLRWLKFSLVGGLGIAVQLAALALMIHLRVQYLLATMLAVEAAVLHNFCWHERYTWADRGHSSHPRAVLRRLARFHLANGLISMIGNLVLMCFLVGELGFPVLLANLATVASCWLANCLVSDRWVFLARTPSLRGGAPVGHQQ
jgi:putative flippase GtrA